ncbi:MAG: hypothetical protein ACE5GJ_07470 [Gemmatimonadota bacterium]
MVADARLIASAAHAYAADYGTFLPSAGYGTVPPALEPYLPENFRFVYKGVRYAWFSIDFPDENNWWRTRSLGVLIFNYTQRREIADAMYQYYGPNAYWSPSYFYFIYRS